MVFTMEMQNLKLKVIFFIQVTPFSEYVTIREIVSFKGAIHL